MSSEVWNPSETTDKSDGKPDTAIVPYVQALNEAGIETYQSCSGHQDDDGSYWDGHLWITPTALTEAQARELSDSDGIHTVCKRFARQECWEIQYPGCVIDEETLRGDLTPLFETLGVEMP